MVFGISSPVSSFHPINASLNLRYAVQTALDLTFVELFIRSIKHDMVNFQEKC